jgi:6-phosphogluconolactonase
MAELARFYVGTYTGKGSEGIYRVEMDTDSGRLGEPRLVATAGNPTFLALHPGGGHLYAGSTWEDNRGGVTAFKIDPASGELSQLNRTETGRGSPCHLVVDGAGRNVLAVHYGDAVVAVVPLANDGSLKNVSCTLVQEGEVGPHPRRQERAHAHSINVDAAGRHAYVADLGLDRLFVYDFDAGTGTLTGREPVGVASAPGAGPRHFTFHPRLPIAYLINELDGTMSVLRFEGDGGMPTIVQTVPTLPAGFAEQNTTAEVAVHPTGRFVYGSNRGHDSIAVFSADAETGELTALGHTSTRGTGPRHFAVDPSGRFLVAANQGTGNVVSFRIDADTGALTYTGNETQVSQPVCVRFVIQ